MSARGYENEPVVLSRDVEAVMVPVGNHLWQSTLFAMVTGLLTLACRRNLAQVRPQTVS